MTWQLPLNTTEISSFILQFKLHQYAINNISLGFCVRTTSGLRPVLCKAMPWHTTENKTYQCRGEKYYTQCLDVLQHSDYFGWLTVAASNWFWQVPTLDAVIANT